MTTTLIRPTKSRAKPIPRERPQQEAVVEWLRLVLPEGSKVFAIKNEEAPKSKNKWGQVQFQKMRKSAGVLSGMPDLGLDMPGRFAYIEMKAPADEADGHKAGIVSSGQQDMHAALTANGHPVGVATDIESARFFLLSIGVELREARGQFTRRAVVRVARRKDGLNDPLPF